MRCLVYLADSYVDVNWRYCASMDDTDKKRENILGVVFHRGGGYLLFEDKKRQTDGCSSSE